MAVIIQERRSIASFSNIESKENVRTELNLLFFEDKDPQYEVRVVRDNKALSGIVLKPELLDAIVKNYKENDLKELMEKRKKENTSEDEQ